MNEILNNSKREITPIEAYLLKKGAFVYSDDKILIPGSLICQRIHVDLINDYGIKFQNSVDNFDPDDELSITMTYNVDKFITEYDMDKLNKIILKGLCGELGG